MALIPPVSAGASSLNSASFLNNTGATQQTTAADSAASTQRGNDFGNSIGQALDDLQASQTKADGLAQDAATGKLKNIEEYLIAASDAQLSTQLTVAVRNKAVESFNEIMRMQI